MSAILFTNLILSGRTGTEIYTVELAKAMLAKGHRVAIYALTLGKLAAQAQALGIPVTDDIGSLQFSPDIIHGHHNVALATAMLRYAKTPAVFVCHDSSLLFDEPIILNRIGQYVAVDGACRERLRACGAPEQKIKIIQNAIDTDRFTLREKWNEKPKHALMICKEPGHYIATVEEACKKAGLALDIVGPGVGNVVEDLPARCRQADIVFAYSRNAMEAIATGAFTIVTDVHGYGGVVDAKEIQQWPNTRLLSRSLDNFPSAEKLIEDISRYSAKAAEAAAVLLRKSYSMSAKTTEFETLYQQVIDQAKKDNNADEAAQQQDNLQLARFFANCVPRLNDKTFELKSVFDRRFIDSYAVRESATWLANPMPAGATELSFCANGNGHMLLQEGWHDAEDWGVWANSDHASILVPRSWIGPNNQIDLIFTHFSPSEERTLHISVNKAPPSAWLLSPEHSFAHSMVSLDVPTNGKHNGFVTIDFNLPISVKNENNGAQARSFGVGLIKIKQAPIV